MWLEKNMSSWERKHSNYVTINRFDKKNYAIWKTFPSWKKISKNNFKVIVIYVLYMKKGELVEYTQTEL